MQISEIREIVTYGWGNFLGKGYSEFVYFSSIKGDQSWSENTQTIDFYTDL